MEPALTGTAKLKFFNDPIYGFIGIPDERLFRLIEHPLFQRLRRISQMGMSYLVFPGAHHTRFHHALGSMYLMQRAITVLKAKGIDIVEEEETGLLIAILLHDLGHGPFSHALEGMLLGLPHEAVSLAFMEQLDDESGGELGTALSIFRGDYPRPFLHQLVSGQLDMDRLDYLKRDSFFAGVSEGNINAERLIGMLDVTDGRLVVDIKGAHSVEAFLVARQFMYWQVYLHKTSLGAEQLLVRIIARARELLRRGEAVPCSTPLRYFLQQDGTIRSGDLDWALPFSKLDDTDVMAALKEWTRHSDFTLAELSRMLIDRDLPEVRVQDGPFDTEWLDTRRAEVMGSMPVGPEEVGYFVHSGAVTNQAYRKEREPILFLDTEGSVKELTGVSEALGPSRLTARITKHFAYFPRKRV